MLQLAILKLINFSFKPITKIFKINPKATVKLKQNSEDQQNFWLNLLLFMENYLQDC